MSLPEERSIERLVSLGTVVVDAVMFVAALPERGGDVFASRSALEVGGGFTAMAAARRGGLRTVHAGTTGTGPFGDLARAALTGAGIETALPPLTDVDTGLCLVLVEPSGERTFVTMPGAEGLLEPGSLGRVAVRPTDAVLLSGYGLAHPVTRLAILAALAGLPEQTTLVVDPGPLGHELAPGDLGALFARADWWTCNAREATLLTGVADAGMAAVALTEHLAAAEAVMEALAGSPVRPPAHAVVRVGAEGCIVAVAGRPPFRVSAVPAAVASTSGAGDAHTGALIAALAAGRSVIPALRLANSAAVAFLHSRRPGWGN
ncbi:PfkB family carbohydrate kinase [Cryobacterium sp.]|jgi:sugar/nucleoside kinase (ribokinase family)|uniref:PfkB family carbohydrate kinase n=1 Tax=Cryobacterium sp. TaxID=1926290 RepID=UPI00260DDD53|nr:PfkB family carbohydrate kinase [Cryobacterium sp.]MCU1444632.1 sugar kinase [Cryobacterium sp.]